VGAVRGNGDGVAGGKRAAAVRRMADVFVRNDGVATARQLRAAGLSRKMVGRLVRTGIVRQPRRGVYVARSIADRKAEADTAQAEAMRVRAVIARAPGSQWAASHSSAAVIHGLDLLDAPASEIVTVTQPKSASGGSRSGFPGVHVHTASLPPEHIEPRFGVTVTTVARTVADLARAGSFRAGVVVADSALHAKKTTHAELNAVLASCERFPGVATARRVVAFADQRSESPLESIARVLFAEHGLEPPELQVWLGGDETPIGRVDFYWPAYRVVAETDGKGKYRDPRQAIKQLKRDKLLRDEGFEVVHFTWAEIMYSPAQVIAALRAAFERAAPLR
jgi:predicted transcriptional regulator of viral defense system